MELVLSFRYKKRNRENLLPVKETEQLLCMTLLEMLSKRKYLSKVLKIAAGRKISKTITENSSLRQLSFIPVIYSLIHNSLILLLLISALMLSGCASSGVSEETPRYERKPDRIVNVELAEREYIRSSKIHSIEKINFELDSKGIPVKAGKISTQKFDRNGMPEETITYDRSDNVQSKFLYEYNDRGVRITTSRFNSAGQPVNIFKYDYNNHGNKIKTYKYDLNNNLQEYYIYNYDNRSNLIEEIWYNAEGKRIYRIEHSYNHDKKSHTFTYDEKGGLLFKYVYKYDRAGNIIEEVKFDNYGDQVGVIQYIYKYY
jgi:hypothetical protein